MPSSRGHVDRSPAECCSPAELFAANAYSNWSRQLRACVGVFLGSSFTSADVRAMRNTHSWLQTHTAEEVLNLLPEQFHSDSREADLATLRVLMAGLSHDGRMPSGAPENVRRLLSASITDAGKVDLAATWTNEFVDAP